MAIRPVDLQLAYLAGPQNAAAVSSAQDAPKAAQQAAQSAFASQLVEREESVTQPKDVEGQKVRSRDRREPSDPRERQRRRGGASAQEEDARQADPALSGESEHLIDVIA